jgi:hypothetical protein
VEKVNGSLSYTMWFVKKQNKKDKEKKEQKKKKGNKMNVKIKKRMT